jgi:hypothetical protein
LPAIAPAFRGAEQTVEDESQCAEQESDLQRASLGAILFQPRVVNGPRMKNDRGPRRPDQIHARVGRYIPGVDVHEPVVAFGFLFEVHRYLDGGVLTIYDNPWPGFTPDLLSIVLVTAIQARGSVLIHQKMFESRLFFVDKLIDMGAQIILCDPHRAVVIGLEREQNLRGITMSSPDIRAGVSLLIAALSAEGKSIIQNIEQIDRGYQYIDERLRRLGADIKRIEG